MQLYKNSSFLILFNKERTYLDGDDSDDGDAGGHGRNWDDVMVMVMVITMMMMHGSEGNDDGSG